MTQRPRDREPAWLGPSALLRGYLIGGSLVLAFGFLLYTQSVVNRLERQGLALVRMLRYLLEIEASDSSSATVSPLGPLWSELRTTLHANLPVVVTDPEDTVVFAAGVPAVLGRTLSEQPHRVREMVRRMDRSRSRLPIRMADGGVAGYIHWGRHRVTRELRWIPPLEVLIVGVFMLVGLLGLRRLKAAEQRSLWYGMAREAAHQMGTPISSLMGWLQLLKAGSSEAEGPLSVERIVAEMDRDVERLSKIARRFERIGHEPSLQIMDVQPILEETANYFRARLPREGPGVRICEEYGQLRPVRVNKDLLMWVLENLIRNSLESIQGEGRIVLRAAAEPRSGVVRIQVEDSGCGMTAPVRSRAFRPGFSTKERGWGLGLAMAKRIVEEGHGGRLRIVRTQPGRGTTIEITLPSAARGRGT